MIEMAGLIRASALTGGGTHAGFCPIETLARPGLHDIVSPLAAHVAPLLLGQSSPTLWVQDGATARMAGRPYARGLGLTDTALILVRAQRAGDALWAMEEAVRAGLAVIGEIEATARALDFTATRRLALFAREMGVRCALVRTGMAAGATSSTSGASWRWRIRSAPSLAHPCDAKAPGAPCWTLDLVRARDRAPGRWRIAREEIEETAGARADEGGGAPGPAHRLRVVPPLADRDLGEGAKAGAAILPFRPSGRAAA